MRIPSKPRSRPPQGLAVIELLMSLPLLAALFVVLLTVAGAGLLVFETVIEARQAAWSHLEWTVVPLAADRLLDMPLPAELVQRLGRIHLDGEAARVQGGGVAGDAEALLETGPSAVIENLPAIKRSHDLFVGVWDDNTIPFPDAADHPHLRMDGRFKKFGLFDSQLGAFRALVP